MNKKKLMIYVVTLCCAFLLSNTAYSKKKILRYPIGCTVGGFKFDYYHAIFKPTALHHHQSIYFIHNISKRTLYMISADSGDRPYKIHVNGFISPKRWSVVALDQKTKFICTNYNRKKNKHNVIDCSKALEVCEYQRTRFGTNTRGNYWVVKNRSRRGSVNSVRWHGILLTDPKKSKTRSIKSDDGINSTKDM